MSPVQEIQNSINSSLLLDVLLAARVVPDYSSLSIHRRIQFL
jgi:hypothetical protein